MTTMPPVTGPDAAAAMTPEERDALVRLVTDVVARVADIDPSELAPDRLLFIDLLDIADTVDLEGVDTSDPLDLDSLDMLDTVVGVEQRFGTRFDLDASLEDGSVSPAQFATIDRVVTVIGTIVDPALRASVMAGGARADG
jgi:acyl carrier protein